MPIVLDEKAQISKWIYDPNRKKIFIAAKIPSCNYGKTFSFRKN